MNPYFSKKQKFNKYISTENPFKPKQKKSVGHIWRTLSLLFIIASFIFLIILGLTHPFLKIKIVNIEGTQKINETELADSVKGIINFKKLGIFSADNYFLVNVSELKEILMKKYALKSIVVEKIFPNKIKIYLEEKISTLIYDNGINYSYVDLNGKIIKIAKQVNTDNESEWDIITKITTSTDENGEIIEKNEIVQKIHKLNTQDIIKDLGDFPIIYDRRVSSESETEINKKVLQNDTVNGIVGWFNYLRNYTDIPLSYFVIENELGNATIKITDGWELKVALNKDMDRQVNQLQTILKNNIGQNIKNIQYIDLRYDNRVFWK